MSDALYQQALKDLAQAAHGAGALPRHDRAALRDNPLCGDRIRVEVRLDAGVVRELGHQTKGCLLCRAAAAVIGLRASGHTLPELADTAQALRRLLAGDNAATPADWPELALFAPVAAHRSRHSCVLLPFETLLAALAD